MASIARYPSTWRWPIPVDAIRFDNVRLEVRGATLLEGFSLSLAEGDRCTLSGVSGGGKSTLLHCLLGFAQPSAGTVAVLGTPVTAATVWEIRRKVAWVAQEPDLGSGSARNVLERPFHFRANKRLSGNLERVPDLAAALRLQQSLLDQPVDELSGGEKQRVAILAALLLDRPVLLLDEAASALDPASRDAALELLRSLKNTTLLSVSHDAEKFHIGGDTVRVEPAESPDGSR